jgi:hypothetical protein
MRFLSVYKKEERNTPPTQEEMTTMGQLIEKWMKKGALLSAEGCLPSVMGARVRLADGNLTVKDGPFTESKEVIGGLAIIQAQSKQDAIALIQEFLRVAGDGECELRQLYDAESAATGKPCTS